MSQRICFVVNEYPVPGHVGGFGILTRDLATGLKKAGWDVCVLIPRHPKIQENIKKRVEFVNEIPIFSVPTSLLSKYAYRKVYEIIDADIFHHEDPTPDSWFTVKYGPKNAKHIITFQDPPDFNDIWMLEELRNGPNTLKKIKWRIKYELRHKVLLDFMKHVDEFYSEARFLIGKAKKLYGIKKEIGFLPNPIYFPKKVPRKAKKPTVCFLGRWDAQKRPWIFFELAQKFPEIEFIAMGQPQESPEWLIKFKKKYGNLKNLKMVGFVSEKEKSEILGKSWAIVSTSIREGLPIAFLETLARETAIISYVNPDGLPEKYGFWAKNNNFEEGLNWLLDSNEWKRKGKWGRKYVEQWHEYNKVIKMHEKVYKALFG